MKELDIIGDGSICPVVAIVRVNSLLIGLRHYTPDKWKTTSVWTFPGGRCDDGEQLLNTLKREVAEETGINDLKLKNFLGRVRGAKAGDWVYIFTGETNLEPTLLEPEKFSEWKWTDVDQIPKNFINSRVLNLVMKEIKKS